MATPSRVGCLAPFANNPSSITSRQTFFSSFSSPHKLRILTISTLSVTAIGNPRTASELVEEEVLEAFFRDRELNGDLISRASDIIFTKASDIRLQKDSRKSDIFQAATNQPADEGSHDESDDGFLTSTRTQEWVMDEDTAPLNKKSYKKELQDDSGRWKRLNSLNYEALKRELLFLTIGIGAACSGYCLITLSVQTAVSYAVGVAFSCLYLQLLYKHVDELSKDSVPQIFMQKTSKKKILTGITSDDIKDVAEKWVKGSGIALSSPRLVIPAAIYGLWALSQRYLGSDFFDFQIAPAILGMFAYKGAALVQIYRDNEELKFEFPENDQTLED
ncbi:hypothetical protein Dimus_009347 [Dionaea muscipula]